jgi:NAD(P)-dependent dehydrogenase (short-subunit alcohol dehydrogenase family)
MLTPDGRVVMVSGASRGIGRAVAERLSADGFRLSLGARNPASLADLAGPAVLTHAHAAESRASAEAWVQATLDRFGRLDGLVNNAGSGIVARLEDDDAAFEQLHQVNTMGPLRLLRAALPHLRQAGTGRIVNVISLSGKRVANDNTGYAMSKFAALALSHAVRRAAWDDGVRVCAVCPSFVATDMTAGAKSVAPEEMIQPADLASLIRTVLLLPNTAVVSELLVNCRFDPML